MMVRGEALNTTDTIFDGVCILFHNKKLCSRIMVDAR